MINKGMMTSNTPEWATPLKFFEELDNIYHFNLDPCATDENHKCTKYFTKEDNGLIQNWGGAESVLQPSLWKRNF